MAVRSRIKLWSIGGGKGGIGKSIFTLGLGICLAGLGKKVILIDGDLGGANLHTLMGVRFPDKTLEDFLLRKVSRLEDTVLETDISGIGLICGADDILGAANPTYSQKIRLLKQIEDLPADFILLDLGAGTSFNTLDLFNYSPGKITLFTSQTTSLQNAYGFIKSALYRKLAREFSSDDDVLQLLYQVGGKSEEVQLNSIRDLLTRLQLTAPAKHLQVLQFLEDFLVFLVVNMVKNDQDLRAPEIIQAVCSDFLSIQPQVLGDLAYDTQVEQAVNQMKPLWLHQKKSKVTVGLDRVARRLLVLCRIACRLAEPSPAPEGETQEKEPRPALPEALLAQPN